METIDILAYSLVGWWQTVFNKFKDCGLCNLSAADEKPLLTKDAKEYMPDHVLSIYCEKNLWFCLNMQHSQFDNKPITLETYKPISHDSCSECWNILHFDKVMSCVIPYLN